ncbi:MAG: sulfate adenylyltransferase subunit CysD [Deltaproteobacteria bacterium]|mgnify:CR=1 FL=1|nr:sulfate adenylyltransferase subunit CysD [Deltaproteobacteria bacterium]|tara:strand:- start:488 stop:1393 length:906 start_codon:yes stop_codon:yes gene_type:complete
MSYVLTHLKALESESIHIFREVVAEFQNPVMLWSMGKDSSVLLRLAQKAFHPGPIPFPLMHVDTGVKFPEMYEFRSRLAEELGFRLLVETNEEARAGCPPLSQSGRFCDYCSRHLKTEGLLGGLQKHGFDAAIGGARREEERSRAKERVFSFRDDFGAWDPKNQRPELWNLYNARVHDGESIRVFPLSNWTEADIWRYIQEEQIEIVPLYYAKEHPVVNRGGVLLRADNPEMLRDGEEPELLWCRYRTLGCMPCTGAVPSRATTIEEIVAEALTATHSERENRIVDQGTDTMEDKKRDGYF